jgi:hypothetical protein
VLDRDAAKQAVDSIERLGDRRARPAEVADHDAETEPAELEAGEILRARPELDRCGSETPTVHGAPFSTETGGGYSIVERE